MGFPTVYDTTILNEHPFLVTFGPETNFWMGHEVGRVGQNCFVYKQSPRGA